jgi:hypothetical protein
VLCLCIPEAVAEGGEITVFAFIEKIMHRVIEECLQHFVGFIVALMKESY